MNDRENVARDGEYAALSRRIVDVVLDTFGCNLGSDGPEILCQAQDKVGAELAGQFGKHHGGLGDVKERTRLEAHLRFQAEVLEQIGDAVVAVDGEERITYLNRRAIEQYALEGQEILGRQLSELYEYRFLDPKDEGAARAALAQGGRWRGLNRHIRQDGRELIVESSVSILDDTGHGSGLLAVMRDVTAQIQVERERDELVAQIVRDREALSELAATLEQERDLLNTIMDSTQAQIAYLDPEFSFVQVNNAYCQGAGYDKAELIGCNHFDLFPNDENQAVFERVRDTGEAVFFWAKPFTFPDRPELGPTYWDWRLAATKDKDGDVAGLVLSLYDVTEREQVRRVQEELLAENRSQRAQLQAIIDNAPEGIIVVDEASHVALANPAAHGLYAQPVSCAADRPRVEPIFSHPDGTPYEPCELPLTRSIQGETCVNEEMPILGADGERHNLLVSSAPIYDSQGELGGAVGLFQDVTELRQAQRALNESQERLRIAVSAAEMGTWHWDLVTDVVTRDSGLLRILGLEPSESMQTEGRLLQKVHPDDRASVTAEIERAINDRSSYRVECRVLHSSGAVRSVRVQGRAFYDTDGQASILTGVLTDITEKAEAWAEIERLRQRNELILLSAGEGILGLDPEGRVTFANPAAAQMVGCAAEELIGKPIHDAVHHTQADGRPYSPEECLIQSTLADGATYSVSDEVFWRKDGTSFPVGYASTPIVERGKVEGSVLVFRDISERKQAEQAVADLAKFPDENPNPVMRISQEGKLLYANQGSEPLLALWDVQVGQQVPDDWRVLASSAINSDENAVVEVLTGERTFALTVAPVEVYVNVYGHDVSAHKYAEEVLRRYSERLRILHEADRAILAAQTAEEIATAALRHMRGLVPFLRASVALFDAEAGEMSLLAVHPENRELDRTWRHPLTEDFFFSELKEGRTYVIEDRSDLVSPSTLIKLLEDQGARAYMGVPLIVQDTLIGSLNLGMASSGVPDKEAIEIAQEIADELAIGLQQAWLLAQVQRHAEELEHQVRRRTAALRVSRARFQAIFEEAAIGIALVNRTGRILDSNPALQHMLGYHSDELEGMLFSDLAHSDNVTDDAKLYEDLVGGQRTFYRVEGRYVRKDGQPIDANLIVSLVRPAKGRARFAIALVEDVTEAKQAQAALIESEKLALTGRMAASLAHEINNPLQSVIGCLSLAEEDMAQGKDALQYVTIALEELERAADLIARMRDLSRPHEPDEQVSTDVNALLERVLALMKKKCEERHVEVAWNPGADVPKPTIVADRMQQVFLNLVLNAVDAMPDGGRLEVHTARTDDSQGIEVRFSDTGDGVPADDLSHLFEPFYTTKAMGMGLGLYVSHSIVENHGGRIDVESVEGKGTTFAVWLPV